MAYCYVATPVSCLADIVAGIAESVLSVFQGDSNRVPSILRKKWIASPIQYFVFLICNLCLPIFFRLGINPKIFFNPYSSVREKIITGLTTVALTTIIIGPMCGFFAYQISQRVVGQLPHWAHPEGFNIFINGGCLDPCGRRLTDHDYVEELYSAYKAKRGSTKASNKANTTTDTEDTETWEECSKTQFQTTRLQENSKTLAKILKQVSLRKNC